MINFDHLDDFYRFNHLDQINNFEPYKQCNQFDDFDQFKTEYISRLFSHPFHSCFYRDDRIIRSQSGNFSNQPLSLRRLMSKIMAVMIVIRRLRKTHYSNLSVPGEKKIATRSQYLRSTCLLRECWIVPVILKFEA